MNAIRRLLLGAVLALPACESMAPRPGFVTVSDNFFEPSTVMPASDGTVMWIWNGQVDHDVIFDDTMYPSGTMTQGTHTRDFTGSASGTYGYRCTLHGSMVGRVVVP